MALSAKEKIKSDRAAVEEKYLDLAVKGDAAAFGELVGAYEKLIYNIAYSAVSNPDDAYDLSQEIFLKAWTAIGKFRGESSFSTWLHRIAYNASYDFLKEKGKLSSISIHEYADSDDGCEISLADTSPGPDKILEEKELRSAIAKAVEALEPEYRTVVLLRDMEGFSYEEIAQIAGINIGTVKSRINRARNKLCDILKGKI